MRKQRRVQHSITAERIVVLLFFYMALMNGVECFADIGILLRIAWLMTTVAKIPQILCYYIQLEIFFVIFAQQHNM